MTTSLAPASAGMSELLYAEAQSGSASVIARTAGRRQCPERQVVG
jgi:hypothetical protein